jgi:hypothetical protein
MLVGTRRTSMNRLTRSFRERFGPRISRVRVDCARWTPRRSSRPSSTIHGGLRRARRAKLVSSGLPLFDGFVVRSGPECRPRATSTGALPWCPGPKARTPSSRRERLCDPRFQAEITSSSRLPPRDPEARFSLPGGSVSRARGVEESFAGILRPYSWSFLHSTMFTGTPYDRASPSTSPHAPARSRE